MLELIRHQMKIPWEMFWPNEVLKETWQLRAVSVNMSMTLKSGSGLCITRIEQKINGMFINRRGYLWCMLQARRWKLFAPYFLYFWIQKGGVSVRWRVASCSPLYLVLTPPSLPSPHEQMPIRLYMNTNSICSWNKSLLAALQIKPQSFMMDCVWEKISPEF